MFQDSVSSTVLLSLVDMTVVFLVLAFLMVVVYVTYFFVGRVKQAPPPSAPSADESEIVAVQAAALSAYRETQRDLAKPATTPSDSLWKRSWFWTNTKPNSR